MGGCCVSPPPLITAEVANIKFICWCGGFTEKLTHDLIYKLNRFCFISRAKVIILYRFVNYSSLGSWYRDIQLEKTSFN